ncbi:TRM11 family SAM-dependent methyltransferase [Glacieibacterium megasporae]|uniref:TRM11 family SAM-dependent methyltransferase n=1 Tax=Glacieibacterium megasporae TaxID=2835787 RepID=UPI001C1E21F4|nr:DNA methyltransferase [Polymorphobacter megasporae]UAJ10621.1 site-specific DNA-methyltransferase [Polymorphobacter megasporae]
MSPLAAAASCLSDSTVDAGPRRLLFANASRKLTHNVFRYPAKFHPPVARSLVDGFSRPGETVFDPFCGSGTTLVEALVAGRNAVGTDVDPLAVFIASAKVRRYDLANVATTVDGLTAMLRRMSEADLALWGPFIGDIPENAFAVASGELSAWIPELPRMNHWFRRRVVLQLAAIRRLVEVHSPSREFARLCFAAIIRNASNADPVPVSGLEVTSHMRAKEEAGRSVDPYGLMIATLRKTSQAVNEFADHRDGVHRARVAIADARTIDGGTAGRIDAVITSPPYLTAVDYYRRHTLEMYWLGLTASSRERLKLLPRYIGRDRVSIGAVNVDACSLGATVARRWRPLFGELEPYRSRVFVHYCVGIAQSLGRVASLLPDHGKAVVVVGNVRYAGQPVDMGDLIRDLAPHRLRFAEELWYPLANRYMSYSRRNDADIDSDRVMVFEKRG